MSCIYYFYTGRSEEVISCGRNHPFPCLTQFFMRGVEEEVASISNGEEKKKFFDVLKIVSFDFFLAFR